MATFGRVVTPGWMGAGIAAAALGQAPPADLEPVPPPTRLEEIRAAEGAVLVRAGGRDQAARVALVDYEEIEPLVRGVEMIWRSDRTVTRLRDYQAGYRTHGGLEIATFGRGQPGVAALSAGWTDRVTSVIQVGELQKLGELLAAAKAVLDAPVE